MMNLTELLRRVLRSNEQLSTLGEEIDLIRAYLGIEQARFEERLEVQINIPEVLRSVGVPPLILQPLVENCIKHGIADDERPARSYLAAMIEDFPDVALVGEAACGPQAVDVIESIRPDLALSDRAFCARSCCISEEGQSSACPGGYANL